MGLVGVATLYFSTLGFSLSYVCAFQEIQCQEMFGVFHIFSKLSFYLLKGVWLFLKLTCNEDSDRKLCMIACREEIKPERSHHRRHSGRGSLPVSCWAVDFLIDTAV